MREIIITIVRGGGILIAKGIISSYTLANHITARSIGGSSEDYTTQQVFWQQYLEIE